MKRGVRVLRMAVSTDEAPLSSHISLFLTNHWANFLDSNTIHKNKDSNLFL